MLEKICMFFSCQERRTMSPSEVHTYVNSLRYMFSFIEVLIPIQILLIKTYIKKEEECINGSSEMKLLASCATLLPLGFGSPHAIVDCLCILGIEYPNYCCNRRCGTRRWTRNGFIL